MRPDNIQVKPHKETRLINYIYSQLFDPAGLFVALSCLQGVYYTRSMHSWRSVYKGYEISILFA